MKCSVRLAGAQDLASYNLFHINWTTFNFNRSHLGMVSIQVTCLLLLAFLMCTFKWLYRVEIQCHKWFHLKPNAVINQPAISSFTYGRKLIFNDCTFRHCSFYSRSEKTWRSGYCYLNKGECNLNQSKDDSFVERVAKNETMLKQWRPPQSLWDFPY